MENELTHLSDTDLERYYLGMVREPELTALEQHIVGCGECAQRAEDAQDYVDAMRVAIIDSDLE